MKIDIKEAKADDIKGMADQTGWGYKWQSNNKALDIYTIHNDRDIVIGFMTAKIITMGPIDYRIIEGIYVKPDFRGLGVAQQIYEGADALEIANDNWNKKQALIKSWGFNKSMDWRSGLVLAYRPTPFESILKDAVKRSEKQLN